MRSRDFQSRKQPARVVLENVSAVFVGERLDCVYQRFNIVKRFAGFRIWSRSRAGIFGPEHYVLAACDAQQQLKRLARVQTSIEVQHAQLAIEFVHRAAAFEDVIGLPATDLIGHRSAAVGNDDLQLWKILQDPRIHDRQDCQALFGDEMLAIVFAAVLAAGGMDQAGKIQLHHLFPQRIPVFVAERGRAVVAFARICVDQQPDESEILDAAVDFRKTQGDGRAGSLRDRADALKSIGERLHLLGDVIVIRHRPRFHDLDGLLGVHELEGTRRKKLNVGPDGVHDTQVALGIGVIAHPLVGEFLRRGAMRPARRHLVRFPLIELGCRADVGVNIDNHLGSPVS